MVKLQNPKQLIIEHNAVNEADFLMNEFLDLRKIMNVIVENIKEY